MSPLSEKEKLRKAIEYLSEEQCAKMIEFIATLPKPGPYSAHFDPSKGKKKHFDKDDDFKDPK